jgi:predicted acyltransferase
MAGTATNYTATKITNQFGSYWVALSIPAAAARITLFTDGTPDATANPSAKHLGHTSDGWEMTAKTTTEDQNVDEQVAAVDTIINELAVALAANLVQTQDVSGVLQHLVSGFGTYGTAAGYEQIQLGISSLVFTPSALIFPSKADPTKYMVYNLYKSRNDNGLANQIKRKTMGNNPVAFKGYAITSRALTDTIGNFWLQI